MSDDEAFIRAIVDSPGDETPRLVYADWLEERGDPRAAYLRAEQEAFGTGDTSGIQRLAEGLESVWVARVTLPPLGVCCEHVQFRNRGPVIDAQEIEQFERRSSITLPSDYRAFLLNYNGGLVGEDPCETPDGKYIHWGLEHKFYSLKCPREEGEQHGLEWWASSRGQYIARQAAEGPLDPRLEKWFLQFIQVGESPDPIFGVLLGVAGSAFGQVRYFDYSGGLHPLLLAHLGEYDAGSFAAYLARLPNTGYP
jgi:uncharacterized protein (TIGR02996 family)